jgi:hypothetical protein
MSISLFEAERAYRNDPSFHAIVDCISKWIIEMHVTPAEARAAAMYAAIRVENMRVVNGPRL